MWFWYFLVQFMVVSASLGTRGVSVARLLHFFRALGGLPGAPSLLPRFIGANLAGSGDMACIGVPAHFTDSQREATQAAAERAGLSRVRLLEEPVADFHEI